MTSMKRCNELSSRNDAVKNYWITDTSFARDWQKTSSIYINIGGDQDNHYYHVSRYAYRILIMC